MLADWEIIIRIENFDGTNEDSVNYIRDLASDVYQMTRGEVENIDLTLGEAIITAETKIQNNLPTFWDRLFSEYAEPGLVVITAESDERNMEWRYDTGKLIYLDVDGETIIG